MFSRKRRFYEKKSFYAAVAAAFVTTMAFAFWMGGGLDDTSAGGTDSGALNVFRGEGGSAEGTGTLGNESAAGNEPAVNGGEPDHVAASGNGPDVVDRIFVEGYFVVEEDGYIRIYRSDESGDLTPVRTTEIRFDLLSGEDQQMFRMGVELEREDQLMELLQDFES